MLDSHKEEQRNVVAAQEDLLLRGRIVFFFIGDVTTFVYVELGRKVNEEEKGNHWKSRVLEQVKMVFVKGLILNKSQRVHCPLQESSYC